MNIYNTIIPDNDGKHKYMIVLRKNGKKIKTIHFGQAGASDFTQHKDEKRQQLYIQRHKSREDWNDEKTSGYYSFRVLWQFKSLNEGKQWVYNDLKKKGYN